MEIKKYDFIPDILNEDSAVLGERIKDLVREFRSKPVFGLSQELMGDKILSSVKISICREKDFD